MAGEWLKFEANTPEKPEVFAMTVALGWDDPDLTVGKLLKVWRWFDQQTIDGNAPSVTLSLLDRISGVTGFAQSMCNVGWLLVVDGGLRLPNFSRHNGKTAKDRALTAKRVAKHKGNGEANAKGNAAGVSSALPKEEKRREDSKPPLSPDGGKRPAICLRTFLDACEAAKERPVRDYQPLWLYVESVGLDTDMVALAWAEFCRQMLPGGVNASKRQADWRKTFRNYVEKNYLKLWAIDPEGKFFLTTAGKTAQKMQDSKEPA
jgi:hypothetical protein